MADFQRGPDNGRRRDFRGGERGNSQQWGRSRGGIRHNRQEWRGSRNHNHARRGGRGRYMGNSSDRGWQGANTQSGTTESSLSGRGEEYWEVDHSTSSWHSNAAFEQRTGLSFSSGQIQGFQPSIYTASSTKPALLREGVSTKGICALMCPTSEMLEREAEGGLSVYEATEATANLPSRQRVADPARAVKKYRRSAAGRDMYRPDQLRPLPVLEATVDYLLETIYAQEQDQAAVGKGRQCGGSYVFVEDRLRAVRQDVTVQGLAGPPAAKMLQKIANFYVLSGYLMCEATEGFDDHLHGKELQAVLATLQEISFEARVAGLPVVACEDEYSCYQVVHALGMTLKADTSLGPVEAATCPGVGRVFATVAKRLTAPRCGRERPPSIIRSQQVDEDDNRVNKEFTKVALAARILGVLGAGNWAEFFFLLGRRIGESGVEGGGWRTGGAQTERRTELMRRVRREGQSGNGYVPSEASLRSEAGLDKAAGRADDSTSVVGLLGQFDGRIGEVVNAAPEEESGAPLLAVVGWGQGQGRGGRGEVEGGGVEAGFVVRLRCLCHSVILSVRCYALQALNCSMGKKERVPLTDVARMLCLRDTEHAFQLCKAMSLPVSWDETPAMSVPRPLHSKREPVTSPAGSSGPRDAGGMPMECEKALSQGRGGGSGGGRGGGGGGGGRGGRGDSKASGWAPEMGKMPSKVMVESAYGSAGGQEFPERSGWVMFKSVPARWSSVVALEVFPVRGSGHVREDAWVGINAGHGGLWDVALNKNV